MSDKMIIVGKDGETRYIIEDDIVTDIVDHKHIIDENGICIRCGKHKDELEPIKDDINEHRS